MKIFSSYRDLQKMTETSTTLHHYWELASNDPSARLSASQSLIDLLVHFQSSRSENSENSEAIASMDQLNANCAPDMAYALKRLIRGLPSGRQGARQGFAVTLTEVLIFTILESLIVNSYSNKCPKFKCIF